MVVRYDKGSSSPNFKYVEAGVLVLRREILNLIKEASPISLEKGLYSALIEQREMAAYVTRKRFYDIGTPQQQMVFAEFLKREAE